MPILNLNGTSRKTGRTPAQYGGDIHQAGMAAKQHPTVRVAGVSYNSPFTPSSKSVFPGGATIATQPQVAPLKAGAGGAITSVADFTRTPPNSSTFFNTNVGPRPVVNRAGGPSRTANTPSNPNAVARVRPPAPKPRPVKVAAEHANAQSFFTQGGTIGSHANSSSNQDRWSTTKKGAAD